MMCCSYIFALEKNLGTDKLLYVYHQDSPKWIALEKCTYHIFLLLPAIATDMSFARRLSLIKILRTE